MSRFYLLGSHEIADGAMRRRIKAGSTVADSTANAVGNDVVAPGLCAQPNIRLIALDTAAVAAFAAVGITASVGQPLSGGSTGADSVDA
jgi:hypothetical protein